MNINKQPIELKKTTTVFSLVKLLFLSFNNFNPIRTGVFSRQSWTGGKGLILAPPLPPVS